MTHTPKLQAASFMIKLKQIKTKYKTQKYYYFK